MEIRQLEYVVGIVDHGGFTRAATALHVTQPALSEGVARLERELGLQLFHRVGRQAVLSAAGTAFVEPARQVLRDVAVLRASAAGIAGLEGGTLELVVLPTLAVHPLVAIVGAFRRAHRAVAVRIDQPEHASDVADYVRSGAAEVGLSDLPVSGSGLASCELVEQELMVILPPSSPLGDRRRVRIEDLADVPLVATPIGTSTRTLIEQAFADAGVVPNVAVESEQREAILPLVLADAGATILPRALAETAASHGASIATLSPPLRRSIGLVWRDGPLSPAAASFVAIGREVFG